MTAVSPKWRIKQKFQAGHTENDSGQGDLTDFSITHSLPYSVTECGYVILWPPFPRLRLPVLLTHIPKWSHTCTNTHLPTCFYQKKIYLWCFAKQLLRKLEHTSSLSGMDCDRFCHQTVMYEDARLRTTQRINTECLRTHSPRLQQHKVPSFTQTALAGR